MPKNIEDMIVPERKKSIRDIPIPEGRRRSINVLDNLPPKPPAQPRRVASEPVHEINNEITRDTYREPELPRIQVPDYSQEYTNESFHEFARPKGGKRFTGKKFWLTTIGGGLVALFILLSLFSGATLAYTPKATQLTFAGDTYTAQKTGEGELLFSVVKLSGEKGMEVTATGEEQVSRKASGTIVIYNTGAAAQPLVKTTRFESPDGKIYRINEDVTVPAKGSVEALVSADQPGEIYNLPLSDFTLPGLKGTSKFSVIYARSKTPISGGFVGLAKSVSSENLENAKATIESELKDDLIEQVRAQVPEDFVLFPSLSSITYEELPQTNAADDKVTINVRGNLNVVMFKRSDLAGFLASKKGTVVAGEAVEIPNIDNLQITFGGTVPADLLKSDQITLKLDGSVLLVWRSDEDALRTSVAGRKKGEISSVLVNYPSVARAEAILRPFWKSSFPSDPAKVKIKKLEVDTNG